MSHVSTMDRLEILTEATPTFKSFEDLVKMLSSPFIEYEVENGFCVGCGIEKALNYAVQILYTSAGAIFPPHSHKEFEYFVVIEGEGYVEIEGKGVPYKPTDCFIVRPGEVHKWTYYTNTKAIIITIPASEGFPDGKNR